jgi:hypothetical protein
MALLGEALAGLRCKSAVIDGELVFPARDGRPIEALSASRI